MSSTGQFVGGGQRYRLAGECSDAVGRRTFQEAVLQALQLPRDYREIFMLCDIQGLSVLEAANALAIGLETALKRLKRARRMLAEGSARWD
jgi:DNA-directed RNA polymerase specialized sigma24 family protein